MTVFLSTRNPTVPPHRLLNIPVLGRLCSVLFPILPLSQCCPKPTELKNYFLSTSTGFISGSQRMRVSVPFKHSYPSSDTVSEGSWHPCSAAFLLSSEPHSQGLHTLSMSHCLAGCVTPFKLPALAPCPCTASALTGAAVWLHQSGLKQHRNKFSGGPPTALHPFPSCHAHIDTRMRTQSHVHFLALFQQAENKKVGTSGLICRDRIPELISHQHLIHLPVLSSRRNDSLCASNKSNKKKKLKYKIPEQYFSFFEFFFFS